MNVKDLEVYRDSIQNISQSIEEFGGGGGGSVRTPVFAKYKGYLAKLYEALLMHWQLYPPWLRNLKK